MILFLILSILIFHYSLNENNIIFVFEHTRHGARGPLNDEIFNQKWIGSGELTNVGKRMHYLLGYHNKKKYEKYYSKTFNPNEFLIYSTTLNRTIMSINSQLNGWFPYEYSEKINNNQIKKAIPKYLESNLYIKNLINKLNDDIIINNNQIFPIHTLNDKDEKYKSKIDCPKINILRKENTKRLKKEIENFNNNFIEVFGKDISKFFKPKEKDYYKKFMEINSFCDKFQTSYFDGRNLNLTNINLIKLNEECDKSHEMRFLKINNHDKNSKIGIYKSGNLMKTIIYYMEKRIKLNNNKIERGSPKFLIFSGHDSTLSEMQDFLNAAFGKFKYNSPTFASNLFFEVVNVDNSKFVVNIIFNDKLIMNVDYKEFKEKVEKRIMSEKDIIHFCYGDSYFKIFSFFFIILDLVIIVVLIIIFVKRRRNVKSINELGRILNDNT